MYTVLNSMNVLFVNCLSSSILFSGSPGNSDSNNLPAMQETLVQSLCQEDPLEKEMATHYSILAWRIPQTDPGGL